MTPLLRLKNFKFKNLILVSDYEKKLILKWRNDFRVRRWMDNKKKISFLEHSNFLKKLKNEKNKIYFLISKKNKRVGVFTLNNIFNKKAKIGFYISPFLKKREIVLEILYYSLMLCFKKLKLNKIYGYSEKKNQAANKLNELLKIKLKNTKKYKNKFLGHLSKKNWEKNVEKDNMLRKYLNYLK
jgi:UDP-4-amino-4,6-dideoxy-N-acetyl-beta-L-altrosamine N-acetyltransferase